LLISIGMIEIKNIVCAVDLSDVSRHALDHALAIARWYGARVTVLHVVPPVSTLIPPGEAGLAVAVAMIPNDLPLLQTSLEAFVRTAAAGHDGTAAGTDARVAEGNVVTEIAGLAMSLPADLLVMGTHGRSGFERFMLGSVTEKMLRKAPCPLLTVPPRAGIPPAHADPFRRILCGVDFSPSSLRALQFAESLAEEADAELVVMHVIEPVSILEPVVQPGAGPGAGARAEALQRVQHLITRDARTYSRVSEVVVEGKAHVEILREAASRQSELIALGAHSGHRALLAFGSTPNHVVREAVCPVLIVRD
jgi:nucleotide-binding universal stress UspA family protein